MDSAFDDLDAAGFLEIWQHFDADGEDSWLYFFIFFFLSLWIYPRLVSEPFTTLFLDKEK